MNIGESFKWSSPYVVFREDFFEDFFGMWSYKICDSSKCTTKFWQQ